MAANVTITVPNDTIGRPGQQKVYLRSSWFAEWTPVQFLFADQLVWSLCPQISTAQLTWRFGPGMRQGEQAVAEVERLSDSLGKFVKIEVPATDENGPFVWYGTVEIESELMHGMIGRAMLGEDVPAGVQPLTAVGLESLLYHQPVRTSVYKHHTTGHDVRIDRPLTFNLPGPTGEVGKNRSTGIGFLAPVFSPLTTDDAAWSSRDIVRYLTAYHRPTSGSGSSILVFPDNAALPLIPDWDQPVIDTFGKSVGKVLDEVLPRGRAMSWCVEVDEFDWWRVRAVSLLGAGVTTVAGTLLANPRRLAIEADGRPDWNPKINRSIVHKYQQVRIRGARATSTCTLSYLDSDLELGVEAGIKGEYDDGASGLGTYAGLGTDEKQRANQLVRSAERLFPAYRRFAAVDAWDQTVKDGDGSGDVKAVFPLNHGTNDGGPATRYPVYDRELWVLPSLPLKDGIDYTTLSLTLAVPETKVTTGPFNHRQPIVVFREPVPIDPEADPLEYRYCEVEKVACDGSMEEKQSPNNRKWYATVQVPEQDRAVFVNVHGQPQHAIAATDFVALAADEYPGAWDWRFGFFTVALADDRYCEGVWPLESNIPGLFPATLIRTLVLDAGPKYRRDWLVPNTVVGVDDEGALIRSTGGWVNDDNPILLARAQQAYQYYSQRRVSIAFETNYLTTLIKPGDYVERWGREAGDPADPRTVGSVVSQIVLTLGEGGAAMRVEYTTDFAELDPSVFV